MHYEQESHRNLFSFQRNKETNEGQFCLKYIWQQYMLSHPLGVRGTNPVSFEDYIIGVSLLLQVSGEPLTSNDGNSELLFSKCLNE